MRSIRASRRWRLAAALPLALAACSSSAPGASPTPAPGGTPPPGPSVAREPAPEFSVDTALEIATALASDAGPREATGPEFRRAASDVAAHLIRFGYRVRFEEFGVPSGRSSNGKAMKAGKTRNVVGEPPDFDPERAHLLVGAHLDTVPGSPGANDNASGIGVLVELARLAAAAPPRLPVVFVAFGAEEKRRDGAAGRLYGSRHYVEEMDANRREALVGAVSIDMVGAGDRVFLCTKEIPDNPLSSIVRGLARRLEIRESVCPTSVRGLSDHAPFEDEGYPAVWLWGGDHPDFHTPSDTTEVLERAQVGRVGELAWEVLRRLRLDRGRLAIE